MNGFVKAIAASMMLALPAAGAPVINEISYRPGVSYPENTSLEFVEIHNPGSGPVDLSGWALTRGVDFVFPAGTTMAGGSYLVIAADPVALALATGSPGIMGPWEAGDRLANGGEEIRLSQPDGVGGFSTVDSVTYADEGDWGFRTWDETNGWSWNSPANGGGKSLERRNPLLAVDNGQNWGASAATGGSPGVANSLISGDIAPVIRQVSHSPAVPRSGDVVTISCELLDENPATSLMATLHWRNATASTPGPFQQLAMSHQGNGRFTAALAALPDGSIVEFYVSAGDGTLTRSWPAPTSEGQTANCAYQVDDEVESTTAPTYRLILTAAENDKYEDLEAEYTPTANITRIKGPDRKFNTTFVSSQGSDSTIRYRAGMRIRGSSSRKFVNKSLQISMPTDDLWDGVSKFGLNAKFPWLQFIGMRLCQAAGLPGSDATPVEVRRNGVERVTGGSGEDPDYGLWVRMEAVNGDYVDNHWPTAMDVQIYRKNEDKTEWSNNYTAPATPDGVYSGWIKRNQSGRNDWSDVVAFSDLWQATAAPYFNGADPGNVASGSWNNDPFSSDDIETLSTVVDFDQMARWMAVMALLDNRESSLWNGEDEDYAAAWVSDGTYRRMQLVPHDLDTVLGLGDDAANATKDDLFEITETGDIFEPIFPLMGDNGDPGNADFLAKYMNSVRELFGGVFDSDTSGDPYPPFHAFVDNHLGDWVPADVRDDIKSWMTSRQNFLLGKAGGGKIVPPAPTSLDTFSRPPAGELRINEVLALNTSTHPGGGTFPDLIELHNTGPSAIALAGHVVADESNEYVFPPGSGNVPAGGYRLLTSETLGFGLSAEGDRVQLRNSTGGVLDEIAFGPQIADLSLARTAADPDVWALCLPTIAAANGDAIPLGVPGLLSINEWAGNVDFRLDDDFIEIHNAAPLPVALGGMHLTDHLTGYPARFTFPPLSFSAPGSFLVVDSGMLGFGLNGRFENLWLSGANGTVIRGTSMVSQHADESTGLSPDGGSTWMIFPVPTPGLANAATPPGHVELLDGLRVTELMYDPAGGGDFEFIELQNTGAVELDLGGVRFTNGISYTVAPGTLLAAGDYLVVCKDRASFLGRYPDKAGVLAAGSYTGSLSNDGESIGLTLPAPFGLNILSFKFDPGWYPATAGAGYSLHTRDPSATSPADWGKSGTWTTSAALHGSPGSGEPPVITSVTAASGIVNNDFSYVISATGSPTSFAASGLPDGLGIGEATGLISGVPTVAGEYPVEISATGADGVATATLTLSVIDYGPLDHFTWDYLPVSASSRSGFAVKISARDAAGHLKKDYAGSAMLSASAIPGGESPLLISEVSDGAENEFELQNVSGEPADTTGWTVVLGDSPDILVRNAATFALPASVTGDGVLRISESNSPGRLYFGGEIGWDPAAPRGWIMLLDAAGGLRDFVAFGQWTAGDLDTLSIAIGEATIDPVASGHWTGAAIAGDPAMGTTHHWQRGGSTDHDDASDWTHSPVDSSLGSVNPALALPWPLITPLTLSPAAADFQAGEFLGLIAVAEPADQVTLKVADAFGHSGTASIDVLAFVDADKDGMPDNWEDEHGLSSADSADAALDSDGDGQSNLAEFQAGTDPQSAGSAFAIATGTHDAGGDIFTLEWNGVAGKLYRVSSSPDLVGWTLRATRLAGEDGLLAAGIATEGESRQFYRVEVESLLVPEPVDDAALHHFAWDYLPVSAYSGIGFAVRILAKNGLDEPMSDFEGSVTLGGTHLAITPGEVPFTAGEFVGIITAAGPEGPAVLKAMDASGPFGDSPPLDLLAFVDADEDEMPDDWEDDHELSSAESADAALDSDGDGQSNLAEFQAGTDPQSPGSVFAITSHHLDTETVTFTVEWPAVAGKLYHVTSSETLLGWSTRATRLATESGTLSADVPTDLEPARHFRVEIAP